MKRADERDTIFARMRYEKGSPEYEEYYKRRPEKKELDDLLRSMPALCSPGTETYDPVNAPIAEANFRFLEDIRPLVDGETSRKRLILDPEVMTRKIKAMAVYYGAPMVGIARLGEQHFYCRKGRPKEDYGRSISVPHPFGIVFAVPMDMDRINQAPGLPVVVESSLSYVKVAIIGMLLSYYIRETGYEARNHMDGNYLVVPNRVALDAGMGEFGRCGMLVTQDYGPAVRFAVVTTDLPLLPDKPRKFGLGTFCRICRNCAIECPVQALSEKDDPREWKVKSEKCYKYWRTVGTDCSICIRACPFSQGLASGFNGNFNDNPQAVGNIMKKFRGISGQRPDPVDPSDWI